jgi:hypothetical protein
VLEEIISYLDMIFQKRSTMWQYDAGWHFTPKLFFPNKAYEREKTTAIIILFYIPCFWDYLFLLLSVTTGKAVVFFPFFILCVF